MTPKIIELVIEDNDDQAGLDGIALVEHPAHEALFEYFAETETTPCDNGTCNHYVLSDAEIPQVIQMFNAYGEPQGLLEDEGWVIHSVRPINKQDFAIIADPNAPSAQDTDEVKFRYKYVGPRDKKNRTFCAEMMAANRVFRIEDLRTMSDQSVNPVGPSGYSIIEWRGSYNCRHKFVQLVYRRDTRIVNKASVRTGLIDEDGMPGPDTRTTATIAAGNTPPRTGFAAQGNPDVSALQPYVDQITKPKKKPVEGEMQITTLPLFENKEDAEAMAELIGCKGCHEHQYGDTILYMPCEKHPEGYADLEDACWPGYTAIGTKTEGGREVPNCVPDKDEMSADGKYVVGEFESYTDYPELIKKNAQAALDYIEKSGNPNDCMTQVGKVRAQQLAQGKPISIETVKRMKAYITRHKKDLESSKSYEDGCGKLAMDAWGGVEALNWVESTINKYENNFQVENTLDDKVYDIPDIPSSLFASNSFSSQNETTFSVFNNEQRLVVGAAMIPDKMIIRRNEITGEIYYVYFTPETILKLQQKYMKDKLLDKANIEHQRKFLNGVDVVESWIVEDPQKDKQQVFGMNYPKGTWMIIMSLKNNDDAWEKVKNGTLRGYSVQGYFLEKAKFNSQTHEVLDEIKEILKQIN
jgi:hypothetical protein